MNIRVQREAFDPGAELNAMIAGRKDAGAAIAFVGLVRELGETGELRTLELEHYPGMTERELGRIREEAMTRFALTEARIIHRFGPLRPAEPIVLVLAAAPHRREAFEGAMFMMDFLKTKAPFWKRESGLMGETWVEARDADSDAAHNWAER
ncbi:MAG: molybdenum cofactor biosynthesis protein MoaE [Alphaproteobacteria bacterium]|nr:molybdenum cofactor biosynthesis protein MoaE [Alphaproteobacteria bacterium]